MKDKKIIIIVIISLLLVGIGGYIIYDRIFDKNIIDKDIDKEIDNDKNNQNNDGELLLSDSLVQKLYGYISFDRSLSTGPYLIGISDRLEDGSILDTGFYNIYFYQNKILTVETFDDIQKHNYAIGLINSKDIINNGFIGNGFNGNNLSIKESVYEVAIKKLFGSDITYSKNGEYGIHYPRKMENFTYNGGLLKIYFDESKDSYVGTAEWGIGAPGCWNDYLLHTKLINAVKTNDSIILEEKFFGAKNIIDDSDSDNKSCDRDVIKIELYADTNAERLLYTIDDPTFDNSKSSLIDDYLDIANTITYTFKLGSDNEYHFYSSVIDK